MDLGVSTASSRRLTPPSSWPAAAWPLAVTDLFWTWPQRLSGDWSFLHCGILCRYFSYFTFPSMPGNWGQGEGSISASLDRPGLLWLKAQLQHLVLGVLLLLTTGTPGTSWAHSFRDLCPLRPFPCLLFLPAPAWSLLRIRNRIIYLGRAQPNAQDRSVS